MSPKTACLRVIFTLALFLTSTVMLNSQETANMFLLTVFLRHDQTKNVNEINEIVGKAGFRDKFPPPGIEVVSWYVMMGIGQVVTLRVPPARLREVNLAIEQGAWSGYRTEFYPTYDYNRFGNRPGPAGKQNRPAPNLHAEFPSQEDRRGRPSAAEVQDAHAALQIHRRSQPLT